MVQDGRSGGLSTGAGILYQDSYAALVLAGMRAESIGSRSGDPLRITKVAWEARSISVDGHKLVAEVDDVAWVTGERTVTFAQVRTKSTGNKWALSETRAAVHQCWAQWLRKPSHPTAEIFLQLVSDVPAPELEDLLDAAAHSDGDFQSSATRHRQALETLKTGLDPVPDDIEFSAFLRHLKFQVAGGQEELSRRLQGMAGSAGTDAATLLDIVAKGRSRGLFARSVLTAEQLDRLLAPRRRRLRRVAWRVAAGTVLVILLLAATRTLTTEPASKSGIGHVRTVSELVADQTRGADRTGYQVASRAGSMKACPGSGPLTLSLRGDGVKSTVMLFQPKRDSIGGADRLVIDDHGPRAAHQAFTFEPRGTYDSEPDFDLAPPPRPVSGEEVGPFNLRICRVEHLNLDGSGGEELILDVRDETIQRHARPFVVRWDAGDERYRLTPLFSPESVGQPSMTRLLLPPRGRVGRYFADPYYRHPIVIANMANGSKYTSFTAETFAVSAQDVIRGFSVAKSATFKAGFAIAGVGFNGPTQLQVIRWEFDPSDMNANFLKLQSQRTPQVIDVTHIGDDLAKALDETGLAHGALQQVEAHAPEPDGLLGVDAIGDPGHSHRGLEPRIAEYEEERCPVAMVADPRSRTKVNVRPKARGRRQRPPVSRFAKLSIARKRLLSALGRLVRADADGNLARVTFDRADELALRSELVAPLV